ncbi:hypothetical protein IFT77_12650 [Frigoribacterium sp. CFBP 13729]|uniref:hypothetical protein n=1 Tax=Frigoribacterium sp. CFBP 13729 TaxID=2775293 RepID=UPI0017863850|nr:hypothetical protein [Frigoribacterium sp. CFBP 13729]MBD8611334.1 hypothetical protein [Frigoribacterium sp. CFBP 13729]
MKKTHTKAGAIGLAAATILTGLSFGPAAASAAPVASNAPAAVDAEAGATLGSDEFLLIGQAGPSTFYGQPDPHSYWNIATYPTREAAAANARKLQILDQADGFSIRIPDGTSAGTCIGLPNQSYNMITSSYECGTENTTFDTDEQGRLRIASSGKFVTSPVVLGAYSYFGVSASPAAALKFEGIEIFSGKVDSIDLAARTAELSGRAVPGSTVVINDDDEVLVSDEGTWSKTVTGLTLGMNTITLEQYEDGEKTADATVDIDLAVQPVTATTTFDADRTKDAVLSGTAHPGATVIVGNAAGTEIDRAPASPTNGTWELEIPAPNLGGDYPVTIHQLIDGEENGEITETIAYGAAVAVTRPVPDADHTGGPLTMRGTGEAGAELTVREQGHPDVIGSGNVLASQTWNLKTRDLDDRRHVLEVTQTGKGGNVTTSTVTINPEADGVSQPFELTAPKDGDTLTAPDNQVAFTGTGTTGDTVDIVNAYNGRVIATTTIGEDGTWSRTGSVGFGVQNLEAVVTRDGARTEHPFTITLQASDGVEQPFALTDPKDGDTVIAPTNQVTFTGTGTTGDTVAIVNTYNGRVVATTTVDSKGTWSRTGSVGFGLQELRATVTHAGVPADHPLTITVKASTGVEGPFTLVAPADASTVVAPDNQVTFSGTGTTGARVVLTAGTGRQVVNTIVDDFGNWSATGYLSHQWYELGISYTVPGSAPVTGTTTVTVVKTDAVINPFAIQTPADGATVVAADHMVTFTGTGAAGATVELINDLGGPWERVVARATVGHDGTWTATGGLGFQTYPLAYVHTPGELGGSPATGTTTVTVVAE